MPKIALAQIKISDELNLNVKNILKFIDQASAKKTDIVCFPESCLGEDFLDINCDEVQTICNKCKEKSIYCIIGAHIKEKDKIHNSAILINRKGKVQHVYKKIHLFPKLDLKETSPGKENEAIETDFGKIGIIICWDFAFPEDIKKLSKAGAQIIFCPSYLLKSAKISKDIFRSYPLARAFENLAYFISCDAFTEEVIAESYICSPTKILKKIKHHEGLIIADLDLNEIDKSRKEYNCLR